MYFLLDFQRNIIFGWSAKCGCSHVKNLFHFLQNNRIHNLITDLSLHEEYNEWLVHNETYNSLPMFIPHTTKILLFIRNPYKRLVSGFLNKYNPKNNLYFIEWKKNKLTFRLFVEELIENNFKMINEHHFTPQLSELWDDEKLNTRKNILIDIENINYEYIEKLYEKKIPREILNYKGITNIVKPNKLFSELKLQGNISDMELIDYVDFEVEYNLFYDDDLKKKVYNFYKKDFDYFEKNDIHYDI